MRRCVSPIGLHTSNCVGGVCFARRRRIRGNSALLILSSHRCGVHIVRARTTLGSTLTKTAMVNTALRAARAATSICSTSVSRVRVHLTGLRGSHRHCRGLIGHGTTAPVRLRRVRARCSTLRHGLRTAGHRHDTTLSNIGRISRHHRGIRTNVRHTATTLRVTGLGLSCAMIITPYSNGLKHQTLRRNRCVATKRAVACVLPSARG